MNGQTFFDRNHKKTLFFIIFLIFILSFLSTETFLSIINKENKKESLNNFYDNSDGIQKYKKNSQFKIRNENGELINIQTDKFGFRNKNEVYTDNRAKVVVLGDSFAANINTLYKKSLCELLNKMSDKYVFINAGSGGYSNFQMLKALIYLIEQGIVPQKVLCLIYLGNDLRDNYKLHNKVMGYHKGINSDLTKLINLTFQRRFIQKIEDTAKRSQVISRLYSIFNPKLKNKFLSYFYGEAELYKPKPDDMYLSKALQSTDLVFEMLKVISRANDFDLFFILVPSKAQVFHEFKFISKYNITKDADNYLLTILGGEYNFNNIGLHFSRLLDKHEMEFFDLTDSFKKEAKNGTKLFYQIDLHWNDAGQKMASNIIYNQLISKRN